MGTTIEVLLNIACIVTLGVICWLAWPLLPRNRAAGRQAHKPQIESTAYTVGGLVPADLASNRWIAMPGNRLELGTTGFYILLNTARVDQTLYQLYDPENRFLGGAFELIAVKLAGEKFAREREEFSNFGAALQQAQRAIAMPPRRP